MKRSNLSTTLVLSVGLLCCTVTPNPLRAQAGSESRDSAGVSVDNPERRIQANAHYAAGIGHQTKGDTEAAARELILAAETDPTNAALVHRVAEKFIEWRLPNLALEAIDFASSRDAMSVELFVQQGVAFKLLGKAEEALAAFTEALSLSPGNALARKELVATKLREKEVDAALALIRQGGALPSLSGEQLIGLVETYLQTIALAPNLLPDIQNELAALLIRAEKAGVEEPESQLILADGFTVTGDPSKALELLQGVLERAPDTSMAREKLVDLYIRQGMTADAVAELNQLLETNPKNPSAHYLLGSIAADQDNLPGAINHFKEAISIRPEFEPPYYELVGLYLNSRQPREALDLLSQARIRFPKRFLGEFYTGIALASLRRTKEALSHFIEAESIATQQSPQRLTPFFYFQIGSMHERNGNYQKAEDYFLKSLEANPDDAETLNYLGYMWAEQGKKLDQAASWIKQALKLEPDSAAIQDSMGWVLFQQGEVKKALPFLLNAEAGLDEPDPVILDHLGDAYQALGETEKARQMWQDSLKLEFNERIFQKLKSAN